MKTQRRRQRFLVPALILGGIVGFGALTISTPAVGQEKSGDTAKKEKKSKKSKKSSDAGKAGTEGGTEGAK